MDWIRYPYSYTPVWIGSKCVNSEILLNFRNCFCTYNSGRILKIISFWNFVSSLLSTHFDSYYFCRSSRFSQRPEPLIHNWNLYHQVYFSCARFTKESITCMFAKYTKIRAKIRALYWSSQRIDIKVRKKEGLVERLLKI